jgi:hypothetical protein
VSVEIDASGWNSFVADLSKISGREQRDVIRSEGGRVLERCIEYTPPQRKDQGVPKALRGLWKNNSQVEFQGAKLTHNKAGNKVWLLDQSTWDQCNWPKTKKRDNVTGSVIAPTNVTEGGRSFHIMSAGRKWGRERYGRYLILEALLKEKQVDSKTAIKAVGLTKSSWLQIANALGINVKAPDWVRNATTFHGKAPPLLGSGVEVNEAAAFYIDLMNLSKILQSGRVDGTAIFQRAISARVKAFMIDLEKGVFGNLDQRAKRYPGIFTK